MKARIATEPGTFTAPPVVLLVVKMDHEEFARRYSVGLNSTWEEGMGPASWGYFILSNGTPVFYCDYDHSAKGSFFECSGDLPLEEVADQICGDFGLTCDDLYWTIRDEKFKSFAVTRQDDYGNEFEIEVFANRLDAVRLKDELETYQHKQSYSIEGREEPLPKKGDGSACRI